MKRLRYSTMLLIAMIAGLLLLVGPNTTLAQSGSGTASSEMFGDGADGDFNGGDPNTVRTALSANANAGQSTVSVADASGFSIGKEILIIQTQGSSAGNYEFGTRIWDYRD